MWSVEPHEHADGRLLLAVGGVEDHPLDRTGGFFGYIDSFLYLYDGPERRSATNLASLGVVTPKALAFELERGEPVRLLATGYASEIALRFTLQSSALAPDPEKFPVAPRINAIAPRTEEKGYVVANSILDAWVMIGDGPPKLHALSGQEPAAHRGEIRVGELMFFTTLMAPGNLTDGAHSRFTCETCHFEGYVDGRTHHTGRGAVRATTKPLLGLFNNRPHFTRALDPDLTRVAHAEFRVAGQGSGHDPWFPLPTDTRPWLAELVETKRSSLEPEMLRRSLMRFLMAFTHRPNPATHGRTSFSEIEQRGAVVFRERCANCHSPRLSTDEADSAVPFDQWASHIFAPAGAIVWGSEPYRKTGVEPYVHDHGARTTSLRRLYKKRPYFTNGSAKSLQQVLEALRVRDDTLWHDKAPDDARPLANEEQRALLAFLRLL